MLKSPPKLGKIAVALPIKLLLSQPMGFYHFYSSHSLPYLTGVQYSSDCVGLSCWLGLNNDIRVGERLETCFFERVLLLLFFPWFINVVLGDAVRKTLFLYVPLLFGGRLLLQAPSMFATKGSALKCIWSWRFSLCKRHLDQGKNATKMYLGALCSPEKS